jgi:hypothetical protein
MTTFPGGFIANTDIHSANGRHWCAFYFSDGGREAEFFDSYGRNPAHNSDHFATWLDEHAPPHVQWSRKQIQSDYSDVCGLYCLFYLRQRLSGRSMREVVNVFSATHQNENDEFIHRYVSLVFPHCSSSECEYNQMCIKRIKRL